MAIKKGASFNVKEGAKVVHYADISSGIQYLPKDGIINIQSEKIRIGGFGVSANSLYKINEVGIPYEIGTPLSIYLSNVGISSDTSIGGSEGTQSWVLTIGEKFGVTEDGTLYAMNGMFQGEIQATSGRIGNILIQDGAIISANGNFKVDMNGNLYIGGTTASSQLKTINDNISDIGDNVQSVSGELEKVKGDVETVGDNVSSLVEWQSEASMTMDDYEGFKVEVASTYATKDTTNGLASRIKDTEDGIDSINGDISDINGNIETINGDINEINRKASMQLNDYEGFKVTVASTYATKSTTDGLSSRLSTAEGDIESANENIDSLNSKVSTNETSIRQINKDVSDISTDISAIGGDVTGITNKVSSLDKSLGDLGDSLDALDKSMSASVDDLGERMSTAEATLNDYDGFKITVANTYTTKNETSNLRKDISDTYSTKKNLTDAESRINKNVSDNYTTKTATSELSDRVGDVEENVNSLSSNVDESISSINTNLGTLSGNISSVSTQVSKAEAKLNEQEGLVANINKTYVTKTEASAIDTNIIYTDLKISNTSTVTPSITPTTTPSAGLTPEKTILLMGQVNIKEGTLNVRKLPSADSPIVLQLKKDYEREGFHLQRLYKRRIADNTGVMRSTFGKLRDIDVEALYKVKKRD